MTVKTRTCPGYKGHANDLLYFASSGVSFDQRLPAYKDQEAWLASHKWGQTNRSTSVGSTVQNGTESITTGNGVNKENPCFHTRIRGVNVPYTYCIGDYCGDSYRYFASYWRSPLNSGTIQLVAPAIDYQFAKSRAYFNMRPRFEGDVSMLNFLYELKDFRDIANALPNMYKNVGRAWDTATNYALRNKQLRDGMKHDGLSSRDVSHTRYYRDVMKRNSADVKRSLTGIQSVDPTLLAAEAWLLNAFAIQPLIKDISAMLSQATIAAKDAQAKFKDLAATEQNSHYSEKFELEASGSTGSKNDYWRKYGTYRAYTYTATCKYTYDYTMRSHYDAFMRYWGLSGSFEALWNATPWSFLVDYVIQIGKSIHAMERDPNVDWHVKSWLDTTKYVHRVGEYITGDPRAKVFVVDGKYLSVNSAAGTLLSGVEGSIYNRKVSQPMVGFAPPRFRGPSLKQWLNVAALARCFF